MKKQSKITIIDAKPVNKKIIDEMIKTTKKQNKIDNIRCDRCLYAWRTKSKMLSVSCPNCRKIVKVKA
jgi:hypothetical protein